MEDEKGWAPVPDWIDFDDASVQWSNNKVFDAESKLFAYPTQVGDDVFWRTDSKTNKWRRGVVVNLENGFVVVSAVSLSSVGDTARVADSEMHCRSWSTLTLQPAKDEGIWREVGWRRTRRNADYLDEVLEGATVCSALAPRSCHGRLTTVPTSTAAAVPISCSPSKCHVQINLSSLIKCLRPQTTLATLFDPAALVVIPSATGSTALGSRLFVAGQA